MDAYLIDKNRVRASFERAAGGYEAAAVLQKEVCERMLTRMQYLRLRPQAILDAGAGTGYAARALGRRYPASRVVALDIALGMLRRSRAAESWWRQLPAFRKQGVVCGDLENLPLATDSVDLVWSSLAVQWCNDLDRVFAGAARVLRSGGAFVFSTFGPDTLYELREASRSDPHYIHVNRFMDMHDIGDALVRAGFAAPVLDVERFVLTYDDVLGVMRDLKAIGAHNATLGRRRGLEGKGFLRGMAERYEQFRHEGKLPATFEVVYAHAWKAENAAVVLPDGVRPVRVHRR